jgi:hypothetical protein
MKFPMTRQPPHVTGTARIHPSGGSTEYGCFDALLERAAILAGRELVVVHASDALRGVLRRG